MVAVVGGLGALVEAGVLQDIGPESRSLWAVGHRGILAPRPCIRAHRPADVPGHDEAPGREGGRDAEGGPHCGLGLVSSGGQAASTALIRPTKDSRSRADGDRRRRAAAGDGPAAAGRRGRAPRSATGRGGALARVVGQAGGLGEAGVLARDGRGSWPRHLLGRGQLGGPVDDQAHAGHLVGGACARRAATADSRSIGSWASARSMLPERRACHFSSSAPIRSISSVNFSRDAGHVHGQDSVASVVGGVDDGAEDVSAVVEGVPGHGCHLSGLTYREYVLSVCPATGGEATLRRA